MPYTQPKSDPKIQSLIENFSVHALTFLAHNPEALGAFMAHCGCGPQDLRQQIQDPQFLAGMLDYFLSNEPLLESFCKTHNITDQEFLMVRLAFPGADLENI